MLLGDLTNSGEMQTLEATARFAASRQEVIANNIANIDTPNFVQTDLSPAAFQAELRRAVDRQRESGREEKLDFRGTADFTVKPDGEWELHPRTPSGNILFHDRNNRDLEKLMQANAENVAVFRVSTELLRTRYALLQSAIGERV